ncbi:MAG: hypothetical protein IIT56_14015 [Bacteroidales bacterium]|nr:hypothetical protein [Bacteroidales bacterium]
MLKRTRISLFAIFVFLGVVLCGGCGSWLEDEESELGVLRTIPTDAGAVVKIYDIEGLMLTLNKNSVIWQEFRRLKYMTEADCIMKTVDSVIRRTPVISSILHKKEIAVSFHKHGKDKVSVLAGFEISKKEANDLANAIIKNAKNKKFKLLTPKYDNITIYVVTTQDDKEIAAFAYLKGFFVISHSKSQVQASVRHINNGSKITDGGKTLKTLLAPAGKDSYASLIVNYKSLNEIFKSELNPQNYSSGIANFADWSVLDIKIGQKHIMCNGYTAYGKNDMEYLSVFEGQTETDNDFLKYLPSKTVNYSSAGISDMQTFKDKYINFLKARTQYAQLNNFENAFEKAYKIKLRDEIYKLFTNRVTEFTCNYALAGRGTDTYAIAELEDDDAASQFFTGLLKEYCRKQNKDYSKSITELVSVKGRKYYVCPCPFMKKLIPLYFGSLFSGEYEYFVIFNGAIVFAKNTAAIREYINAIENGKTLIKNVNYENFKDLTVSESNVSFYTDITYSFEKIMSYLSPQNAAQCRNEKARLTPFRNFSLQYGKTDSKSRVLTTFALEYTDRFDSERAVSWITPIDSAVRVKPQVLRNDKTGEKMIFIQDETLKIYLFDKDGKRSQMNKKQLAEPLRGEVTAIDYYGNGNVQYLFATENFLHLISQKGDYIENFPVKLPAPLSADISVFDYENNGNYRIFAPCCDRKLYVYTKDGKKLDAWTPFQTNDNIITPVQYFNINTMEYLVFADNLKTYILNRRGEVRINVTDNFPKSKNSLFYAEQENGEEYPYFVTTGSSGEIKRIRMDGSCRSGIKAKHYSANHCFVASDIDQDRKNEYIFTDDKLLEVYNSAGETVFSCILDSKITSKPLIFNFPSGTKIGVVCAGENKIYLYDSKGKLCKGFPLNGTTEFSISKLDNKDKFSVLTGSNENFLYNYHIE